MLSVLLHVPFHETRCELRNFACNCSNYPCLYTQGRTELHDAAERGDVEAVERLLSTSVDINYRTEDVRLSTSECVVSFLTQFIDCCSTGLCIPNTCRKDTLLYC